MMDVLNDIEISQRIKENIAWINKELSLKNIISSEVDKEWINKQILFRYGNAYYYIINKQWDKIDLKKNKNVNIKRWLYATDNTINKINIVYQSWANYRYDETVGQIALYNILSENKPMNILLPIIMVDTIGSNKIPLWTYNRQAGLKEHILWPLCSHVIEFNNGLNDKIQWQDKKFNLIFRGVTTGPLLSQMQNGKFKSSRFEIINQLFNNQNIDVGFTKIIEATKNDPKWNDYKNQVENLLKPRLTIIDMLNNKLILCIEGNDISTAFGWVLASNSVPIHPYPFVYEAWYFESLTPWVHFIPCCHDGSDIINLLEWAKNNDYHCEKIAIAGREYMKKMLNPTLYIEILKQMYNIWNSNNENLS